MKQAKWCFTTEQLVLAQNPPHPLPQAQRQIPDNGSRAWRHWATPAWAWPQPCSLPPVSTTHDSRPSTLPVVLGRHSYLHSCSKVPFQNSKLYLTYISTQFSKSPSLKSLPWPHPISSFICLCGHLQSSHCALLTHFTFFSFLPLEWKLLEDKHHFAHYCVHNIWDLATQ